MPDTVNDWISTLVAVGGTNLAVLCALWLSGLIRLSRDVDKELAGLQKQIAEKEQEVHRWQEMVLSSGEALQGAVIQLQQLAALQAERQRH